MVGSAGESEMLNSAGPTKRADAPLPLVQVSVVVRLVATPAVIFVAAGAAARADQVFNAAGAIWGIARSVAKAVSVRIFLNRVFILRSRHGPLADF